MDRHISQSLDQYITGHGGEDQFARIAEEMAEALDEIRAGWVYVLPDGTEVTPHERSDEGTWLLLTMHEWANFGQPSYAVDFEGYVNRHGEETVFDARDLTAVGPLPPERGD